MKNWLQMDTEVWSLLSDLKYLLFWKNRKEPGVTVKLLLTFTLKLAPNPLQDPCKEEGGFGDLTCGS